MHDCSFGAQLKLDTVKSKVSNKASYSVLHAVDEQLTKAKIPLFWKDWDTGVLSLAAAGVKAVNLPFMCVLPVNKRAWHRSPNRT
jgi:hypothetical protein